MADASTATADPALRPIPKLTPDTKWWFEALRRHELLIQRCTDCGVPRHPAQPMCGSCHSLSWDTMTASGRATVHSFVVNHHPKIPGFDYPLVVGLLDLREGTRLLANIVGCRPGEVYIGMPVTMEFVDLDENRSYPRFRPVPA
jgi:uncharacterized OB-fold protein